jgi:polyhydroxyalkanoate synthesis repressor PhaR
MSRTAMSNAEQSPSADTRKDPKIIKRYTNRKLYDTVESRYVTLEEIAEMIKGGAEVKIVDNRSKEDLTSVTLAQIIFEEEKKKSRMPLGILREIIRTGGGQLTGFLQQQVGQVEKKMASIKEEAEVLRDKLLRREAEERAAEDPSAPQAPPRPNPMEQAKELVSLSQRALEEWQKKVDERARQVVENLTSLPALAKDVAALEKKIEELEKKLEGLEK